MQGLSSQDIQKLIQETVRVTVSEFRHTPPILTKKQVADYLGKSIPTIDRYMREGLPFRKIDGGYPEFYKESVDKWWVERKEAKPLRPPIDAIQCVYLLNAVGTNRYKIGVAQNLHKRKSEIATSSPFPIEIVAWRDGDVSHEKQLHAILKEHRRHLEWFEFPDRETATTQFNQPLGGERA